MKLRCYSENKTVFLSVFYDLVLRSSSGVSLVNDTTTISVSTYYSNDNELVNFDDSCFTWYKDGNDSVFKTGKSFQLSKSDFASDSLTLKCTFRHPESSYQRSEYITITKASNGYSRAVISLYKRSATAPAAYDGSVLTYTFSTNSLSGDTGTWHKLIPSGDEPLYIINASAFANASIDEISPGEWTTPVILSEHGTDGIAGPTTFSLVLYQRSASEPSKPTGNVTYNIKTGVVDGAGDWTKDFPNGSDPCWVISATASTYTDEDTIPSSEWSAVQKLVENGKNGEPGAAGTDAKLIRLSADKTIFSLDSNGKPYSGQVATVTVDKQGIADTHRIAGVVSAPDNATSFKVTPQMMGLEPIKLTNIFDFRQVVTNNSTSVNLPTRIDLTKFNNLTQGMTTLEKIDYLCNLVWVVRASTITVTNISVLYFYIKIDLQNSAESSLSVEVNTRNRNNMLGPTDPIILANKTYSISLYWKRDELLQKYNEGYTTIKNFSMSVYYIKTDTSATSSYSMTINDSGLYNIKELLAQPKLQAMTDSDRLNWMATYLGFTAEAGSTWTIGGKAKNYNNEGTWVRATTSNGNIATSTATATKHPNCNYSINGFSVGDMLCLRVSNRLLSGDSEYKVYIPDGTGWDCYDWGRYYGTIGTEWQSFTGGGEVLPRSDGSNLRTFYPLYRSSPSIYPTTDIEYEHRIDGIYNLTSSGWLAQLSLMGIETNEAIKNWIDTYIPFFEGEMDFPRFPSIEIKAQAGSYTDYLTIGTQIQPRTLRLSSSPINIELDAEGHSDEEVTVTAHTQNIYGDLSWSNNRGLPVASGNVQRFRASQLGLRPITLTGSDRKIMFYNHATSSSDDNNGIYTVTGTAKKAIIYTTLTDVISEDFIRGNVFFTRAKIKNLASESASAITQANSASKAVTSSKKTLAQNEEAYVYGFYEYKGTSTNYQIQWIATVSSDNPNYQVSEIVIVPVTELLAHPHLQAMTDSEKLEWLNTYIPTIKAGESWTIGGKAKNLIDNPTSSDRWYCGTNVTNFSASNGIVTGTATRSVGDSANYWIFKPTSASIALNDKIYGKIFSISATNGYKVGFSYYTGATDTNSYLLNVESGRLANMKNTPYLSAGNNDNSVDSTTVTIDVTKGVNVFNATEAGWIAQLSLMGIEGLENVRKWIDENVPFFVGEFDFPAYRDVTWTAEYEEVADSITIKTITSASALPVYIKQTYRAEELVNLRTRPDGTPVVKGDHLRATIIGEDGNTYYNVPYTYNGFAWVNMKNATNDNAHEGLMGMLPDILTSKQTVPSVSAVYSFFQTLMTHELFAEFISAVAIEVKKAIYGGAYDQSGNNSTNGAGFHLGANGKMKAVEATFDKATVENANITGNFWHTYFRTVNASSTAKTIDITVSSGTDIDLAYLNYRMFEVYMWGEESDATNFKYKGVSYTKIIGGYIAKGLTQEPVLRRAVSSDEGYISTGLFFDSVQGINASNNTGLFFPSPVNASLIDNWVDYTAIDRVPTYIGVKSDFNSSFTIGNTTFSIEDYAYIDILKNSTLKDSLPSEITDFKGSISIKALDGTTYSYTSGKIRLGDALVIYDNTGKSVLSVRCVKSISMNIALILGKNGIEVENVVPLQDGTSDIGTESRKFNNVYATNINATGIITGAELHGTVYYS